MERRPEFKDIAEAYDRIRNALLETPLVYSHPLSEAANARVYFKLENLLQPAGSFKLRGAYNRMSLLTEEERALGVAAVSAGNHSQGVAHCAALFGINAVIFMPENAPRIKVEKTRSFGAEVVLKGRDYDDSARHAGEFVRETGRIFIHPFDDHRIIAGAGTVAVEVLRRLPETGVLIVPVGGGGLITGCAIAARGIKPDVEIIGVQPEKSMPFVTSLDAGRRVETPILDSLADALTGEIISEEFFDFFTDNVPRCVAVDEDSIARAIYWMLRRHGHVSEGGAAVGIAALLENKINVAGKTVVAVITGCGIDIATLHEIIGRFRDF